MANGCDILCLCCKFLKQEYKGYFEVKDALYFNCQLLNDLIPTKEWKQCVRGLPDPEQYFGKLWSPGQVARQSTGSHYSFQRQCPEDCWKPGGGGFCGQVYLGSGRFCTD